jgi:hypothetical protein
MNAVYRVGSYVIRLAHGPDAKGRAKQLVSLMPVLTATTAPVIRLTSSRLGNRLRRP